MKIKLDNPALLSRAIEVISDLVIEVRIKINEFGLGITAIDPANVAMVGFKLPKSAFSEFEVGNEVLGVNLDDFKKILKRCSVKSSLILEKQGNMLNIEIQDRIKRNFSLALIDVEGEDKNLPELNLASTIELNSDDFIACVEDCSVVAESCGFTSENGKFIIDAKGMNSARTEFGQDEAIISGENSSSRYSLEYLSKFLKGAKLVLKTKLNFATNTPLKIDFKSEHFELNFVLAPRVEN